MGRKLVVSCLWLVVSLLCVSAVNLYAGSWPNFSNDGGGNWQTGYYRPISVTNSTGAALVDYQICITLTTAALGNPYTHINADGSDIRFSTNPPPYSNTELSYWVESWVITGTSTIWVKVPNLPAGDSCLYIYYGNPSAISATNSANTFEVFNGLDTFTKVDPGSKITVTESKVSVLLEQGNASRVYKSISSYGDFNFDFEIKHGTFNTSTAAQIFAVLLADGTGQHTDSGFNGVGVHAKAYSLNTYPYVIFAPAKVINGVITPGAYIVTDAPYVGWGYGRLTRVGTTLTLSIFTDSARTTHASGSPVSLAGVPATSYNVSHIVNNGNQANNGDKYLYVQNIRLRKYASPDPAVSGAGAEAQYTLTKYVQSANWTSIVKAANPVAMGNAVAVISFTAVVTGTTTAHWRRFRIDETGGQPVSKLTVSVYEESGNDGFFDAADKFIASGTFNSARTCILNMNRWPLGTTPKTYYIVEKVALDGSGGQTIRLNIADGSYFDFEEGPCIGVPP